MTEFKKDQRVKIEFEAKVCLTDSEGVMEVRTDDGMFYYIKPAVEPAVTITPANPKDYPPQAGDIWETDEGEWFARPSVLGNGHMTLVSANQEIRALDSEIEFRALNPVLVRRREQ